MRIGMLYPVYAKAEYTEGQAITYTGGKVLCKGISANFTENRRDNPAYGDDVVIENDKGLTDYTVAFSGDDIAPADKKDLLGWEAVTGTGSTVTGYEINDTEPPTVGFGWIRRLRVQGVEHFEARWCRLVQFTLDAQQDSTKQKEITWGETAITGTGRGVYVDNTGKVKFAEEMRFDTLAAAKTWLNGKASIT